MALKDQSSIVEPDDILRPDYSTYARIFPIKAPEIPTGYIYFFATESELLYEVRFGRKTDNYLGNVINFGVLNDEFEDQYSLTNKNELYRIIATVIEIVHQFHKQHSSSNYYEFTGEFKPGEKEVTSIRSRLYYRIARRIVNVHWKVSLTGNKVILQRTSRGVADADPGNQNR
jgi:hypothetical protein